MAVTQSPLTSGANTTNQNSYVTASISPGANRLVLVTVLNFGTGSSPNTPTLSGNGLTYQLIDTQLYQSNFIRLSLFRSMGASPSSGAITIDFAGQSQDSCHWAVSEFSGVSATGTHGSGAIVQSAKAAPTSTTTGLATLSAFADAANATFGCFAINSSGSNLITPGSGFTEIYEVSTGQRNLQTEWRDSADTSVDATTASAENWAVIAVEIASGLQVVTPGPFAVEWTGMAPALAIKAIVALTSTLQWANGGAAQQQPTLQWAIGGRASQSRTLQWRVAPSPLRVHYALTGRSGPVSYAFRFERRTIANQFLQDVTPAILGGSIEANNDRDVFRTATFEVDADALDDRGNAVTIDPLADHIAVYMDLLVDGSYTLGLPMGLFALNVPRKRFEPGGETWEIAASDNGIHLMEATTTTSYTVAAAENYITGTNAVRDILDSFGLAHALPTTSLTLPVARTWPAGTPWLRVVNDLLHAAGMYSLWFDASGIARTRAYDDLSTRTPDVTYTGDDFVLIPITEEAETTRLANQVVAVVNDPGQAPLSSTKTNADPDSPISTVTLGRTITKVLNSDAADQSTLDAIAENYLRNEAGWYNRVTLLTSIDPRRDAHEVYELTVDGVYAAQRWWARNWRVQLTIGAQHQHTLGKVERVVAS